MTKQEKIREGITNQQRLRGAFADKILIRHKMTRDEALWEALAYMRYLHSQGVVIKVDRELPFPNEGMFARLNYRVDPMSPARGGVIEAYRIAQQDMGEAGYEAIVPLIEEDK